MNIIIPCYQRWNTYEVTRGGGFRDLPMLEGNAAPNKLSRSEPLLLAVSAPRLGLGRLDMDVSSEDPRFGLGDAVSDEAPSLETFNDSTLSLPGVGDPVARPNRRRRCFEVGLASPCANILSFNASKGRGGPKTYVTHGTAIVILRVCVRPFSAALTMFVKGRFAG